MENGNSSNGMDRRNALKGIAALVGATVLGSKSAYGFGDSESFSDESTPKKSPKNLGDGYKNSSEALAEIITVAGNLGKNSWKDFTGIYTKLEASKDAKTISGEEHRYFNDIATRYLQGFSMRNASLGRVSDNNPETHNDAPSNFTVENLAALRESRNVLPYSKGTLAYAAAVESEAKELYHSKDVESLESRIDHSEFGKIVRPSKVGVALNNVAAQVTPFRDFKRAVMLRDNLAIDGQKKEDKQHRGEENVKVANFGEVDAQTYGSANYVARLMATTNKWAVDNKIGQIFYGFENGNVNVDRAHLENAIKISGMNIKDTPLEVMLGLNEIIDMHAVSKGKDDKVVSKKFNYMNQEHLAVKLAIEAYNIEGNDAVKSYLLAAAMDIVTRSPDLYQFFRYMRQDVRNIDPDSKVSRDYNALAKRSIDSIVDNGEYSIGGVLFPKETSEAKKLFAYNVIGAVYKTAMDVMIGYSAAGGFSGGHGGHGGSTTNPGNGGPGGATPPGPIPGTGIGGPGAGIPPTPPGIPTP